MKILVFGRTGQVGRELGQYGEVTALSREEADLAQPETLADIIRDKAPNLIVIAAAYTAVDGAEREAELADTINHRAPAAIADAAATAGIPVIHYSTDFVFDGSGEAPFTEGDTPAPLSVYGQTKLDGERAVLSASERNIVLRVAWVFSAHGTNFVKTMLKLSETRDELRVVSDQIGGPTAASDIARVTMTLARRLQDDRDEKGGLFHYTGGPDVSRSDFARKIFSLAGKRVTVHDIPSSEFPAPAARPLNSRLDGSLLEQRFGISRPDWRRSLEEVINSVAD